MQLRVDDPSITDDEILWRRVRRDWTTTSEGVFRPTSQTFKDRKSFELSVHIARMTSVEMIRANYPGEGIAAISAGLVRSLGDYKLVRDPILNEPLTPDDPSHALICPAPNKGSHASTLARKARWVIEPD